MAATKHHETLRTLVGELRVALADQAAMGLAGVDVGPDWLQRRATAVPAATAAAAAISAAPAAPCANAAAQLSQIRQQLGPCTRCRLAEGRRKLVFGDGAADARLMLVGEGPGREEDGVGLPFVGEAGRLLGRMLTAMTLDRQQVYVANVIKCRPPANRFPEPDEVATCSPFLWQQIAAVQPTLLVALGRLASQVLLGSKAPMGRLRGQWQTLRPPAGLREAASLTTLAVMPTYHPAYLLRRPEDKRLVWQDLQAVMARLGLRPARAADS